MSIGIVFSLLVGLLMGFIPHYSVSASKLAEEPALTPTLEVVAKVTASGAQEKTHGLSEEAVVTEGGNVEEESLDIVSSPPAAETFEDVELPSAFLTPMQTLPGILTEGLFEGLDAGRLLENELLRPDGVEGVAK